MALTRIHADILAVRVIPNVDDALVQQFNLQPYHRSLAMFTSSIDDVGYTALDEATKRADVEVAYARSFYAGAAHASGPLSGEMIGVLAGPSPDEVKAGIDAVLQVTKSDAYFEALDEEKIMRCMHMWWQGQVLTFLKKQELLLENHSLI